MAGAVGTGAYWNNQYFNSQEEALAAASRASSSNAAATQGVQLPPQDPNPTDLAPMPPNDSGAGSWGAPPPEPPPPPPEPPPEPPPPPPPPPMPPPQQTVTSTKTTTEIPPSVVGSAGGNQGGPSTSSPADAFMPSSGLSSTPESGLSGSSLDSLLAARGGSNQGSPSVFRQDLGQQLPPPALQALISSRYGGMGVVY